MRVSSKRCPGGDPGSRDSRWPFVSGEGAEVLGGSAGRAAPTPPHMAFSISLEILSWVHIR